MAITFGVVFHKESPKLDDKLIAHFLGGIEETAGKEINCGKMTVYYAPDMPEDFTVRLVRLEDEHLSVDGYFPLIFRQLNSKLEELTGSELDEFEAGLKTIVRFFIDIMSGGKGSRVSLKSNTYSCGDTVARLYCDFNGIADAIVEVNRSKFRIV